MLINTDYVYPAELTGFARGALADLTINQYRLAQWLPDRLVDDLEYRFLRGGQGLQEVASYRAYDAESPIGRRQPLFRVTGELPPLSYKIRLGEYEHLRLRAAAASVIADQVFDDAKRMTQAVAGRLELARGEALAKGTVTINENNLTAQLDFGRDPALSVAPAVAWSDYAHADPISDLLYWRQLMINKTGIEPGVMLCSSIVAAYLTRSAAIHQAIWPIAAPTIVTRDAVQTLFASNGLPAIQTYDAQVIVNGTAQRVLPSNIVVLLPGDSLSLGQVGATLYGTTAEALDPSFQISRSEAPGIVCGAYSDVDPVAIWTKAAAIAVPILANPNLTMAATVAAPGDLGTGSES